MNYFEKTILFSKTIGWDKRRTLKRTRATIKKYSLLGLFILVAIPIPTTGAWTGCIAATLLKLDYKNCPLCNFIWSVYCWINSIYYKLSGFWIVT